MTEMLSGVDTWFLQIAVLILSAYFLWSIRNVLSDFKDQVKGLKETMGKLFERSDDFERRLSNIEGRCEIVHGQCGRHDYDPADRACSLEGKR